MRVLKGSFAVTRVASRSGIPVSKGSFSVPEWHPGLTRSGRPVSKGSFAVTQVASRSGRPVSKGSFAVTRVASRSGNDF